MPCTHSKGLLNLKVRKKQGRVMGNREGDLLEKRRGNITNVAHSKNCIELSRPVMQGGGT